MGVSSDPHARPDLHALRGLVPGAVELRVMSILSWLFGLVGWLGVAGAVLAVVLVLGFARSVGTYVWLALIAAVAAWGIWGQYRAVDLAHQLAAKTTDLETCVREFDTYQERVKETAKREHDARQQIEGAYRERESNTDKSDLRAAKAAESRAVALRDDAARLRQQAVKLAAGAAQDRRAGEAATTAAEREADRRAGVLADVLGSCGDAAARLAEIADDSKARGRSCEQRHDNAVAATGAMQ